MGRKRRLKQERREFDRRVHAGSPAGGDSDGGASRPRGHAIARRTAVILAAILVVGFGLRLVYLAELKTTPDFAFPLVDSEYHDYWARAAASGNWAPPRFEPDPEIRTTPYFRPPGYPFFLTAVYAALGDGHATPRLAQMLLGLAGVVLLFFLGKRVFGDVTGLVAAGLAAVYWVFIYYEGELLEPALSVPLLIALTLALLAWRDRPAAAKALGAGVILGALGLVRPNALLLGPAALVWGWVGGRARGPRRVRDMILFVVAAAVVILPVTLRNHRVSGEWVLISSNGGINLLIGNSERADGEVRGTMPGIGTLDTSFDWPMIVKKVEQIEQRRMSHAEVSDFLATRALRQIRMDPGRTLDLVLRKTLLFWGPSEVADNKVVELDRSHSPLLRAIPLSFPMLLALAIAGCVVIIAGRRFGWARRAGGAVWDRATDAVGARRGAVSLIVVVTAVWFASHLPFAVTSRYRVPVIPFLILFGAVFLVWIAAVIRARRAGAVAIAAGMLAVLLAATHANLAGYEASAARWHYHRGMALMRADAVDAAVAELRAAIEENPRYVAVYNDLGSALAGQGKIAESVPFFEEAVRLNPNHALAHSNLALALEYLDRRDESHRHYAEALRLDPSDDEARAGLERTKPSRQAAE